MEKMLKKAREKHKKFRVQRPATRRAVEKDAALMSREGREVCKKGKTLFAGPSLLRGLRETPHSDFLCKAPVEERGTPQAETFEHARRRESLHEE